MARRELIQYIDDLDGKPLQDGEVEIVRFSLDGRNYVIDLSKENAAQLRSTLARYVDAASIDQNSNERPRRGVQAAEARQKRELNRARREWAQQQGYDVADRGALPKNIIDAYNEAHR